MQPYVCFDTHIGLLRISTFIPFTGFIRLHTCCVTGTSSHLSCRCTFDQTLVWCIWFKKYKNSEPCYSQHSLLLISNSNLWRISCCNLTLLFIEGWKMVGLHLRERERERERERATILFKRETYWFETPNYISLCCVMPDLPFVVCVMLSSTLYIANW